MAVREFALGIEGRERSVQREPLRPVHECVLGVLALRASPSILDCRRAVVVAASGVGCVIRDPGRPSKGGTGRGTGRETGVSAGCSPLQSIQFSASRG